MKEVILSLYDIDVIGFIRITNKVYKLKTKDKFYCLKYTTNKQLDTMIEHIHSLQLHYFVTVYKNKENHVLSMYQDKYFYIMPYLELDQGIVKELKIKYYLETIASIHNKTFFQCAISKDYFTKQIEDISITINQRKNYYETMMNNYENMMYRSPSGWMYVLNYYRIKKVLKNAYEYLQEYQTLTSSMNHMRVCLVYNNFNYYHIMMKQQAFISIDKMDIMQCIYDIYSMYQSSIDFIYDFDALFIYYLDKISLLKQEKILLCSLLCLIPMIELEKDEIHNIIKMSRLFYYIDSISSLLLQLKQEAS